MNKEIKMKVKPVVLYGVLTYVESSYLSELRKIRNLELVYFSSRILDGRLEYRILIGDGRTLRRLNLANLQVEDFSIDCLTQILCIARKMDIIAVGCLAGSIAIFQYSTGKRLFTIEAHSNKVFNLIWMKNYTLVSTGSDAHILIIDALQGSVINRISEETSRCRACIRIDDQHFVTGDNNHKVKIWNICSAQCILVLEGHADLVKSLLLSDDDDIISGGGAKDLSIIIWKREGFFDYSMHKQFKDVHEKQVNCLVKVGYHLFVSSSKDHAIKLWSYEKCIKDFEGHEKSVKKMIYLGDDVMISLSKDCLKLWNIRNTEVLRVVELSTYKKELKCMIFI